MKSTCKTCNNLINLKADSCPQCGDKDPSYFKQLKKIRNNSLIWRGLITALAFFMLYRWYITNDKLGLASNSALGLQALINIGGAIVINLIITYFSNSKIKTFYEKAIPLAKDEEAVKEINSIFKKTYE